VYQSLKHRWQVRLSSLLADAGVPRGLAHVHAEGVAVFPDRAARDQGNYRVLVEKALGDALVAGGWLRDDCWSMYEFGSLGYVYMPGVSQTRLRLTVTRETPLVEAVG
jgi:hypothetical protein